MNAGQIIKDLTALKAGKWALRAVTRHPLLAVTAGGLFLGYKLWQKKSSDEKVQAADSNLQSVESGSIRPAPGSSLTETSLNTVRS